MEIFTLDDNFERVEVVENFVSAVWTERYSESGDAQIVVEPSKANVELLKPETFLNMGGPRPAEGHEVVRIESQEIDNGQLKVTGRGLMDILKHRWVWNHNPESFSPDDPEKADDPDIIPYTTDQYSPGHFIAVVVERWAISCPPFPAPWTALNLDWDNEKIPNLTLGAWDDTGGPEQLTAELGPIYDTVVKTAKAHNIGVRLYLEDTGQNTPYDIRFHTYRGKDRTRYQINHNPVIFSPELDELADIRELRSSANHKNTVYVHYGNGMLEQHYEAEKFGWHRKTHIEVPHRAHSIYEDAVKNALYRQEIAKQAFDTHRYIQVVDGKLSFQSQYRRGRDYNLGDVVELESPFGGITNVRVIEYVRAHDKTGEREYPTVAVEA